MWINHKAFFSACSVNFLALVASVLFGVDQMLQSSINKIIYDTLYQNMSYCGKAFQYLLIFKT